MREFAETLGLREAERLLQSKHRNVKFNENIMSKLFKGALAGFGAMKLGGGCFGTILVFVVIWFLLGMCM